MTAARGRIGLQLMVVVLLGALPCTVRAFADNPEPWWEDYPLILGQDSPVDQIDLETSNATISLNRAITAPSWGTYGLMVTNRPDEVDTVHAAGLKSIAYFETFGQSACFIAEQGAIGGGDFAPLLCSHWSWQDYGGGPIVWVGAQAFYDDEAFARPYTRTHPTYGGEPMTYPDGTVATGYDGDPSNPLNSRVFDAGCSKNIHGEIFFEYEASNSIVQSSGPYDGLFQFNGEYTGHISFGKDSACPKWLELDTAMTRLAASQGLDGMWTDNVGPWDSFGNQPNKRAFGDWSVALFRGYLADNFDSSELSAMGVTDVSTFDVRTALRAQVAAWGGDDSKLNDPVWKDARWLDHDLWHAYMIFKRQKGTEAITNYYNGVKAAALSQGVPNFLIAGNATTFNFGWARGNLDMVSMETRPDWSLTAGERGFMLPPVGRMSPAYKLARENARSRFVNVWPYIQGEYSAYINNPGLAMVRFYEMLASHTMPMDGRGHPLFEGPPQAYTDLFAFIGSVRSEFGNRDGVEDVGIYYSSSSVLAFYTPRAVYDFNNQPHQFAHYGWGTALGELHYQYRVVPEWKLTAENLADLRVLIIPNAVTFEPSDVSGVLTPWVQAGGLLIVTGDSGRRFGEGGNFDVNPEGLSLASLTGVSSMTPTPTESLNTVGAGKVLYIPDNIGMEYFTDDVQRPALLSNFSDAMDQVLAGAASPLITAPGVPTTVGLTLYRDEDALRQFVDINNMNIDVDTDIVTPTGPLSFDVALPAWLNAADLRVTSFSPDGTVSVSLAKAGGGRATVSVGSVTHYVSIMITALEDADGDGLTDAQETMDLDPDMPGIQNPFDPNDPDSTGDNGAVGPDGIPDSQNDWDGDGMSNADEFRWRFNPLDAESYGSLPAASVWGLLVLAALLLSLTAAIGLRKRMSRT